MRIIKKKSWPEIFEKVLSGEKKFDLRLGDFEISEGDILIFEEWDPEKKEYTGRKLEKRISYVLKTKDVEFWPEEDINKFGFVIVSLD